MNATMTELAARVAERALPEASDVALAEAVEVLLDDVLDDAAETVERLLGDVGDAAVFAVIVEAVAEDRLRASLAALPVAA